MPVEKDLEPHSTFGGVLSQAIDHLKIVLVAQK